ncbi:sensor histidine kinase [Allobranchiibius sp. GilTou73]|uniref:sensor histidine kinase n=1 Tax=Allobranchiibius sp. GilTou73 TaxID=2904523 RepID=UPI001F2648EF|nr:histidine kinase [Allobranchiibius sp. GilTou73]UIJ34850.1 histidine kinase [Allobranchiibius sp. GilTou73]
MTSDVRIRMPRWWSETWRLLASAVVGALLWLATVADGTTAHYHFHDWWPYVDLLAGALLLPLLLLRRRRPLAVTLVLIASTAVVASTVAAAGIALISLCTHRVRRDVVLAGTAWIVTGVVFSAVHPADTDLGERVTNLTTSVLSLAFAVAVGLFIGARRELVAQLHERAETAERERDLRVAQARAGERARIAREMHDVLAHRISLVAMHSGALAYRADLPPDQVRETATLIQENSHLALTELREVLGVLRDPDLDQSQVAAPLPTLAQLPALIDHEREAGASIEADTEGDLRSVPEPVSRNAFRIVQECLTNARKHSPTSQVAVRIEVANGAGVQIEVSNAMATPSSGRGADAPTRSGLGLIGLTERAVLAGGELTYEVDRAHRFLVRASLPWERAGHG